MASKKRGERERRKRKKKTQGGKNQVCDPEAEGRVRGGEWKEGGKHTNLQL